MNEARWLPAHDSYNGDVGFGSINKIVHGSLRTPRDNVVTPNIPTHVLRFFLSRHCGVLYVFSNHRKENGNEK